MRVEIDADAYSVGLVVGVPDPIRLFEFRSAGEINEVIVQVLHAVFDD